MTKCVFCQIIARELPSSIIYEDNSLIAFMDKYPINPGHILIASKHHYSSITETPEDVLLNLMKLVFKIERSLWKSEIKCEGTNILHSNGEAAGQDIFHVHFHIVPRFTNDVFNIAYGTQAQNYAVLDIIAKKVKNSLNKG